MRFLLDKGVAINAQDEEYGNALQAASYEGHEEIVQLLIGIRAASYRGHERVVQLLLDHGPDFNVQYKSCLMLCTQLHTRGLIE